MLCKHEVIGSTPFASNSSALICYGCEFIALLVPNIFVLNLTQTVLWVNKLVGMWYLLLCLQQA